MERATEGHSSLLDRFERATEVPLLVLSLLMLPVLLVPLLVDVSPSVEDGLGVAEWTIWAVFAFELAMRVALAERRLLLLRRNWPDVVIVVLPFLRPLRIVRSARALRILRLGRVAVFLAEATRETRRLMVRHHLDLALLITGTCIVAAAGATYLVEEGHGGRIDTFGDALWWSATTVTTVGYGDHYPITPAGRGIAVLLMFTGITLFGIITANLAAYFVEGAKADGAEAEGEAVDVHDLELAQLGLDGLGFDEREHRPSGPDRSDDPVVALTARIDLLLARLDQLEHRLPPPSGPAEARD